MDLTCGASSYHKEENMIRILFIIPKLQQGGAEVQLLHILQTIDKKKFDVHLGTLYHSDQMHEEFTSIPGITHVEFNKKSGLDFSVYFRIREYLKQHDIQIVQTLLGNHHSYVPASLNKCTIAIGGIMGTHYEDLSALKRLHVFGVEKYFVNSHKLTLVSCSYAGKTLYVDKGFDKDRVEVIPNGFDYDRYVAGNRKKVRDEFKLGNKKVFGIVGRLIDTKNHRELISAFARVHKELPDTSLMIVGSGPLEQQLKAQVDKLRLMGDVIFTGNRKDVPDLLAGMDIFAFPSLSEGWPNVINEAMAAGLAVVAYPAGDVPKIIKHGSNGFIVHDFEGLSLTMRMLVRDSAKRKSIAMKAKKVLKGKYTVPWMVHEYEKLYVRLLR